MVLRLRQSIKKIILDVDCDKNLNDDRTREFFNLFYSERAQKMFGFKLETRDKGFLLELNQVEKDPIPELPPFPVPSVKTKMCIFIDDNEGALKFYARIAKALGVDALLARNVEEARELSLSQDSVSLVISDYELPDGNGLEITGFFDLERIPMIFVTGRSEKSLEHEILERGAKELLVKPISQKILIERLKQYLNL